MDPDRDTLDLSSDQEAKTAPVFRQALFFSKKQNESFVQLALLTHLGEALAAIDRTVGLGLKGNLGLAAAGSANSGEVLAGTAGSVLASVTAGLAALGLVLESCSPAVNTNSWPHSLHTKVLSSYMILPSL